MHAHIAAGYTCTHHCTAVAGKKASSLQWYQQCTITECCLYPKHVQGLNVSSTDFCLYYSRAWRKSHVLGTEFQLSIYLSEHLTVSWNARLPYALIFLMMTVSTHEVKTLHHIPAVSELVWLYIDIVVLGWQLHMV